MKQYKNRIKTILDSLNELRYTDRHWIDTLLKKEADYKFSEILDKSEISNDMAPYHKGETWGGSDKHYLFHADIELSESFKGKTAVAMLTTGAADIWNTDNPQFIAYINGEMSCTLDMNHNQIILTENSSGDDRFELDFYSYSNSPENTNFFDLYIAALDKEVEKLYYDIKVPFEAACLLKDDDYEGIKTIELLNSCINLLDLRAAESKGFKDSVIAADEFLESTLYKEKKSTGITVHSIGHTHIDVAWKWPLRQTRQKAVRSFLTVTKLMERYPEYKFMSSQPQLYEYVKEGAPKLYNKIKALVKAGRWETEGAMWLEADCNLSSGESLIRHIIYGRKFFKDEFDTEDQEVLWLPDVFGYSVALPQIMKKSGIKYFMTTKIGWNEYNKMPNDTMLWQGLDGSEILTYFITTTNYDKYPELNPEPSFNTTYNGRQNVSQIKGTWQRYSNKELSADVLTCYGYGDGGGGPTSEMLEESRRMEYGICGCPNTKQTFVKDYFHILEDNLKDKKIPKWCGELYLEFHRGTYTSMARNKKNNRECEFLNADAEFFSVLAKSMSGYEYPGKELERAWKLLLLNQFHDILPGSSIKDVYDDSDIQYREIRDIDSTVIGTAKQSILEAADDKTEESEEKLLVFNQLSFERTGIVELARSINSKLKPMEQKTWDNKWIYLAENIISKGVANTALQNSTDEAYGMGADGTAGNIITNIVYKDNRAVKFSTPFYNIELNENAEFISIFDIAEQREVIKASKSGNRLMAFEDRPSEYDAWNIDEYYKEKSWIVGDLSELKLVENGALRAVLYMKKRFLESSIEQYICFYKHTSRIDFKTVIDWKQEQILLKALFPVDILSNKAVYDVQFGNVERPAHENTSWDKAKFEVCAHRWADFSECGYGVSLMNNCKYGYDIHNSVMSLTLLKSGIFPYKDADKELHEFTYSLYPHKGDFREGRVINEAYDLNCPMYGEITSKNVDNLSLISINVDNVFADTIKQAEEGSGYTIRMYESFGKRTNVKVKLLDKLGGRVFLCDCIEREEKELTVEDSLVQFVIKPYEIVTLKIKN